MRKFINIVEAAQRGYFHGTSNEGQPQFVIGHTGNNSSTFGGNYNSTRYGVFFTDNPAFAKHYGKVSEYSLNISNTLNLDTYTTFIRTLSNFIGHIEDQLEIAKEKDEERVEMLFNIRRECRHMDSGARSVWQMFEGDFGKEFVHFLLSQGYDSVAFTEDHENDDGEYDESITTVVLKPSAITRVGDAMNESFHDGFKIKSDTGQELIVEVYKNPSRDEYRKLLKQNDFVRGFLDGETLYVWNGYIATHYDVSTTLSDIRGQRLEMNEDGMFIWWEPEYEEYNDALTDPEDLDEVRSYLREHPVLRNLGVSDIVFSI